MRKNGYRVEELLAYRFFDHTLSFGKVVRKIWSRIFKKKVSSGDTKRNTESAGKQPLTRQQIILVSAFSLFKRMPELLVRKYIHKRNPFFVADGIIAVVKPERGPNQ